MSLQDLEDLALPPPDDEDKQLPPPPEMPYQVAMADLSGVPPPLLPPPPGGQALPPEDSHIPLNHAVALASPPAGPPAATIGMSPRPVPPQPSSIAQQINPYPYLLSRGTNLSAHGLNPAFADRLTQALQAAESATGHKATLRDLYRPPELQAQYYADYTKQPVTFNGVTYQPNPNNQGGLAAPPGRSRHALGQAADVNSGPVLDYLHQNAGRYGLEFLKNGAFQADPGHIQLGGGGASSLSIPAGNQQYNISGGGSTMSGVGSLSQMRQAKFGSELSNPDTRRLFAASIAAEVGGQGPQAEQAYIESVMNRSLARGMTLQQAITSRHAEGGYYPDTTINKLGRSFSPQEQSRIDNMIGYALQGSNVSNFATGNDSGNVHSGGAPIAFDPGTGERFVHENNDRDWIKMVMGGAGGTYNIPTSAGPKGSVLMPLPSMPQPQPQPLPDETTPEQELNDMKDYLAKLDAARQAPTTPPPPPQVVIPTPDIPPVDLRPPVVPPRDPAYDAPVTQWIGGRVPPASLSDPAYNAPVTQWIGGREPGLTHTVVGADGQPQTIDADLAAIDPTIGMTKGIALSPKVKADELLGNVPRLDQVPEPGLPTPEQIQSMTHYPLTPLTPQARSTLQSAGKVLHAMNPFGGGGVSELLGSNQPVWSQQLGRFMTNEEVQTALQMVNPEGAAVGAAKGIAGAAKNLRDPVTGRFIKAEDAPRIEPMFEKPIEPAAAAAAGPTAEPSAAAPATGPLHHEVAQQFEGAYQQGHKDYAIRNVDGRDQYAGEADKAAWDRGFDDAMANTRAASGAATLSTTLRSPTLEAIEQAAPGERIGYASAGAQRIRPAAEPAKSMLSPVAELQSLKEPTQPAALPPTANITAPTPRAAGTNLRAVRAKLVEQLPEELRPTAAELRGMSVDDVNRLVAERSRTAAATLGAPPAELRVPPTGTVPAEAPARRAPRGLPPTSLQRSTPAAPPTATPPAFPPLTPSQIQTAIPAELLPPAPSASAAPAPTVRPQQRLTQTQPAGPGTAPQVTSPVPPGAPPPALPAGMTQALRAAEETQFTPGMYARFGDDMMAPYISFMRKAGVNKANLEEIQRRLQSTTGAQAGALAEATVNHGRAISSDFNFKVDTPLWVTREFAHKNPGVADYLHLYSTLDDIRMKQNAQRSGANQQNLPLTHPQFGPIKVRGETEQSILRQIRQVEHAHPEFIKARNEYQANIIEQRRAEAEGEYGLHTAKELTGMNTHNPNEVPWPDRDYGLGGTALDAEGKPIERPDPFETAIRRMTTGARAKMNNIASMTAIDVIRSSPGGQSMFTFKTPKQYAEMPNRLKARTVIGKRRGVTEHWLARNATVARGLNLNPRAFSSNVAMSGISAANRLFIASTTGLLSRFAKTDAMRNLNIQRATIAGTRQGRGPLNLVPPKEALPWHPEHLRPASRFGIGQAMMGQGRWFSGSKYVAARALGRILPLGPGTMSYARASSLAAQAAEYAQHSFNHTSGGQWLQQKIGPTATSHIATVLGHAHERSIIHMTDAMGAHASGLMSAPYGDALRSLDRWSQKTENFMHNPKYRHLTAVLKGYRNFVTATHGMANMAFLQGNLPRGRVWKAMTQEQREAEVLKLFPIGNDLTGNPKTTGRYFTEEGRLKYDPEDAGVITRAAAVLAHGWVSGNQLFREVSPWHNMILQGGKALGHAFVRNPTETALRLARYSWGPAAAAYYWNAHLGKDPEGQSYVKHQMYGRSEYAKAMSLYWGIPGQRVADGVELPYAFQEDVGPKMMMEAALDHLYGNNAWTLGQDAKAATTAWLDIAAIPPSPAIYNVMKAAEGLSPSQNIASFMPSSLWSGLGQNTSNVDIGGDIYKRKNSPFDQNRIAGQTTESFARALGPTIADIMLGSYAAFSHTKGGLSQALGNAIKQASRTYVQGVPEARDLFGVKPPLSGMTRYQQEMFNRQQAIEQLDEFYRKYKDTGIRDVVRAKPLSKSGEARATAAVGEHLPHRLPGQQQMEPTNPLYKRFAEDLYNKTKHDSEKTGGIGYRSLWDRYREATEGVQSMSKVDYGNMGTVIEGIKNDPETMQLLKEANVDPNNPWQVRNYWEHRRQFIAEKINKAIDETENEYNNTPYGKSFQKHYGRRLQIQDLDPYSIPSPTGKQSSNKVQEMAPVPPDYLPWSPERTD